MLSPVLASLLTTGSVLVGCVSVVALMRPEWLSRQPAALAARRPQLVIAGLGAALCAWLLPALAGWLVVPEAALTAGGLAALALIVAHALLRGPPSPRRRTVLGWVDFAHQAFVLTAVLAGAASAVAIPIGLASWGAGVLGVASVMLLRRLGH